MVVPAGMKDTHYFEVTVKIKQKANTLVDCTTPQNIKVLTTDKITGIPCATLSPPVCPALIVSTSPERTAVIKNDRADLSITEVKATAVPSANKENLTIEYKIANAATASATYNGSVVVSLYNDLNNNGLVEASEVLATHTTTQALGAGVTSTVQTFTYLADQAQVCRLRLAIRNIDNKCLCDDKDVALPTPALGGNLVSNLSTCETASVTFAYNAAAPAYDAYTWSPASYLSAANTPTPTFTYSGAKLTAPLTVTYTLTVKRTNGCESTQTVTVVVSPTTATPAPNAVNLCSGSTIQNLKSYLGGLVSGTLKVYATATAVAELGNTTTITNNTTYYYSAQVTGQCESTRQAILVKIVGTPAVSSSYTYCAGTKVAALWDIIDPTDNDRSLKIYTVASGGTPLDRNTVLQNRTYYVADSATNGSATPTCESARVAVTVNITTVATPTVSATTALCPTAGTQSVSFAAYATALSGNSLRWYATATATVPLAVTPTISTQVSSTTTRTVYVSQVTTAGCEGGRAAITLVVNDATAPTLSVPAPLVTDCRNAAASITTWLGTVTATDSCGTVSLTNNYNAPADFCNVPNGTLTVTFVAKDLFGNTTTQTRTITLVSIKAENDTFTVTHGAVATTTANSVLTNDKVGTQTATTGTVSLTVTTPAVGLTGSATPTLNANGTITVPAGTKSGTYQIGYRICTTVSAVTACDTATATIVVGAPAIIANSDTRTVTNGAVGGTVSSVLTNDSYNGVTNPSTNSVTLTWGTLPAGVVTTTNVGELKVNAGTASGTHQIPYTICDKVNNHNCSTATLTLVIGAPAVVANNDTATVTNGITGGTVSNVLTNDSYNGVLNPNTNSVTFSWGTLPAGVVTTTNIGELKVNPGTASGTHQIPYTICDKVNNHNCSTATLTLVIGAPAVIANSDTRTVTNGVVGGTVSSVLTNDTYNGVTNPSTNSVTLSWGTLPAGVVTTTTVGELKVNAGTASGTHQIPYTICDKINNHNCSTATLTLVIGAPGIIANSDTRTVTNGVVGGTVSSVLTNDSYNGVLNPGSNSVTLSWGTLPAGVVTTTTVGELKVNAGTASGTHQIPYTICDGVNSATNCSTATLTLVIGAPTVTPTVTITANADTYTHTVSSTTYTTTSNVLTNDLIGTNSATVASVTIQTATPTTNKPYIDKNTGFVVIPSGTPTGTHTINYSLCAKAPLTGCSSVTTVTVNVIGSITTPTVTPTITIGEDSYTVTGTITTPTTVGNILTNDSIGGQTATVASVTIHTATPTSATTPRIDPSTGNVVIPTGTPSGTYTMTYYLCERANSSNCSSPTTVTVVGVSTPTVTPTITVGGDSYTVTGTITTPTTVGNILTNDSLGGQTPTVASVTIHTATPTSATTPRIDPSTGNVVIPSGTPSGTYTMSYYLCERANSSNCSTPTTVTVTVVGVSTPTVTPTITVGGDSYTVTGTITTPTTVGNILTNDRIGGQTPTVATVTIHTTTPTSTTTPRIDPNTGNVIIPAGTPSGTYTMTYYLCERANSSNCSSPTTVTVTVTGVSSPTPPTVTPTTIEANGDTFVQNGVPTSTTTLGNILTNDKLNGNLNPAVQSVTITTPSTPAHTPYIHPGTGEVIVPPHTPVGVYELPYTICALASPTVCDTATAVVTVNSIEAHNDGRHLLGTTVGGTISSVLANDKLNGRTPAASEVTINWQAAPAGFTYNADGSITVAAGTAVGTYTISYTLCATATPTLCSEPAEVVVEVTAATPVPPLSITAVYDGVYYIEKGTATTLTSVLANDLLDSDPATTGNVSLTWDISAPAGFTLNADGTAHVATNTAVGRYEIPYTICAKNGTLCSTTKLVVTVLAPTVTPTIEVNGETFTYTGSPTVGNVLTNEKLNGTPNPSVRSVTISIMPPPPGAYEPYLDPSTGDIIVPPHTPAGNYTITYRVCTIDTPVACGVAQVTVVIPATPTSTVDPIAADDKVETARNTPVTINVLANDTPNGATTPNVVTAPLNGTAVVNPDGTIEYTPNTGFVGTDRLVYTLCNASGCATATVNIEVTNKLIVYNGVSVNGSDKNNHFHIAGIEAYPDNTVRIYNRWGVKVWEVQSYDNVRNVFKGISNGRVTVEAADKLPQGTYYYIIEYVDENNQKQTMVGWLYLKKD